MSDCPDCNHPLGYVVSDDREHKDYTHIFEICVNCGYTKAYVEYKDDDTGEIDWSGIE
jgi:RNase P subunit RPR2